MKHEQIIKNKSADLIERQSLFLKDTIEHYNCFNICIEPNTGMCKYSPVHDKTEGCAIGRWLDLDDAIILDEISGSVITLFSYLPNWMQSLGKGFLKKVQEVHDSSFYWNKNGLSEKGKEEVSKIIKRFKLNLEI